MHPRSKLRAASSGGSHRAELNRFLDWVENVRLPQDGQGDQLQWREAGTVRAQADYLAWRLHPESEGREALARRLAEDEGLLVQARFADLLGLRETYDEPGTFNERNWTLRVPEDCARDYRGKLERDAALNLPRVLALALRARGAEARVRHRELIEGLERLAAGLQAGDSS